MVLASLVPVLAFSPFSGRNFVIITLLHLLGFSLAYIVRVVIRKKRSHSGLSLWMVCLQVLVLTVLRNRYRFKVSGLENIPATGGLVVVGNHVSFLDTLLLGTLIPRPVRFVVWDVYLESPIMGRIVRLFRGIPISPSNAKEGVRVAAEHLAAGGCIVIFPEGQISRNGVLDAFLGGYALMARRARVPILPVAIDGLWGSLFSFHAGKPFRRLPRFGKPQLAVAFGKALSHEEAGGAREAVLLLQAQLYAERPQLKRNLAREIVRSLSRHPFRILVIDRSGTRMAFRGATLLALARWCAHCWRAMPEKRIGIVLPPGIAATVTNIACVMLGKSPVNLNFTIGRQQLESCVATMEIKTFVTAQALRDRLDAKIPDFPWAAVQQIIDVPTLLRTAPRPYLIAQMALAILLPTPLLCLLWRIPRCGGDAEAAALCTSGSSGQPKGVPLSHANILGNCSQIDETRYIRPGSIILGNLPVFHSFGFTVSVWFALTRAVRVVNTPSPLDIARSIAAIHEERATLMVSTPTFFRSYLKKASPAELASLDLAVAGAEKSPEGLAEEWEKRFDGMFREGYGTTETSPVVGVNLFDIPDPAVRNGVFVGNKRGSIGRPFLGIATRFTDPISGQPSSAHVGGILWLKGINVFKGYIGQPELTREVLTADGWYCTGDIASMDAEGFIFIKGRLSRFSKIGGEMVPHGTVEDAVRRALNLHFGEDEQLRIAIAARFDEAKGETLVLLTTLDIDTEQLRATLAHDGLAKLWIPRIIKKVDAIPTLATGKLDLQELHQLAKG
ncbi:MAG: AMP-binding protein [Puniceicoccales bacterium]|jgi:acyl-[acyl-carrier-protein]-phospholipid O-acyltransferase/long-chain-fatty-acid--[acyl-carrier-protein] ligase|nr:AMP-binding protein [Puniceicoccales bacterium]